jgi:hypothetical protein
MVPVQKTKATERMLYKWVYTDTDGKSSPPPPPHTHTQNTELDKIHIFKMFSVIERGN